MTPLERALVVYAEARGYIIEGSIVNNEWRDKVYAGRFDFNKGTYRIKQVEPKDFTKVNAYLDLVNELDKYRPKRAAPEHHEFVLDMKFKYGDKVKIKPSFKEPDIVYEIYGFQYYEHANKQCSGISYQLLSPNGNFGHWTREDALELYKPEPIPATEGELAEVFDYDILYVRLKKPLDNDGNPCNAVPIIISKKSVNLYIKDYFVLNLDTKCWEDWNK